MIFNRYLNDTYLDILYSNYNLDYLRSIDENNFIEILIDTTIDLETKETHNY